MLKSTNNAPVAAAHAAARSLDGMLTISGKDESVALAQQVVGYGEGGLRPGQVDMAEVCGK